MKKILLALLLVPCLVLGQTVQFKHANVKITGGSIAGTTISGNTISTGTGTLTLNSGVLNLTAGKTVNLSNSLTFTGTDSSSVAFGTGGTVLYTTANTITLGNIAQIGTNTILGNSTSGTANISALSIGGCSSSSSALIWTTNTGFGCNTGITAATVTTNANLTGAITSSGNAASLGSFSSANLSTALTDETGSGAAVFGTSPTIGTPVLTNPTITNYIETAYVPSAGSAFTVALTNGTLQQLTTNANVTITLPTPAAGKSYTIQVAYGGTHTVTWAGGGTIKWAGGSAPTATSVNGKFDVYTCFSVDTTNTFCGDGGRNF